MMNHEQKQQKQVSTQLLLLLLLLSCLFVQESQAMDFNPDGEGPVCAMYQCSQKSTTAVPKARVKFTSPGCGAVGGGGVTMMSMGGGGGGGGEVYANCCHAWHACYQTCGAPKNVCDETFLACSTSRCNLAPDTAKCQQDVDLKKLMINLGGCQSYTQAQDTACECVKSKGDKAVDRRMEALEYFYKKHAPDQMDKIKRDGALATKVKDSTTKLAGLFQKLVIKYPKAIAMIKDPSQDMYEKVMRGQGTGAGDDRDDGDARERKRKQKQEEEEEEENIDDSDEVHEL